eukprot:3655624-Pyramimonas_sp.AAC.1
MWAPSSCQAAGLRGRELHGLGVGVQVDLLRCWDGLARAASQQERWVVALGGIGKTGLARDRLKPVAMAQQDIDMS